MQSSTGMFFRAVVMLACLIAVPLAALFGTKLPELTKQVLGDRWSVISNWLPGPHNESAALGSTGQAVSPSPGNASGPIPNSFQSPASAALWFADNRGPNGALVASDGTAAPAIAGIRAPCPTVPGHQPWVTAVQASYNEQVTAVPRMVPNWPGQPAANRPADASSMNSIPGSSLSPLAGQANLVPPPINSTDQFTQYVRRLQELGAVYYLLETWGERGQLFRFYCKVAVGGNPNYTRYFDAADADPLVAMGKVVQQIMAWRNGAP
jgi:hypothetical protein